MNCAIAQITRASRFFTASAIFFAAISTSPQSPPAPASPQDQQPHGQVIFSRSTDENGQTSTTAGPAAPQISGQPVSAPTATDADRRAVTFTAFNMDVHLRSAEHSLAVRARVTVRNDGKTPLARIPLQISSALHWERIRIGSHDVAFTVTTLNSDVDHTGQLHEAAIPLATPLAPGATLQLDATYSGAITQSAQRLLAIGTPSDEALDSDWDAISVDFTGLRGFGNVVWYPVSSVPVLLGDGARVFDEMGEHKLRLAGATFTLRLTDEFPHSQPPTVVLINGQSAPLSVTDSATNEVAGIATASLDNATLGFEAPSLFVAIRTAHQASNTTLWALPDNEAAVPAWVSADSTVTPFLQRWLGQSPRSQLTILDLPDPEDAPFETGSMLATAIRQAAPDQLTGVFAHALTHAWMNSPRPWLSEGVAQFMSTLWLEKQSGRQKALEALSSGRMALALAEPSSPGVSPGQPLAHSISPVYYRTKATFVFWMLRDLVGDPALSEALRAYSPAADAARGFGPDSEPGVLEKLLERAAVLSDVSSSQESMAGAEQQEGDTSSELGSKPGTGVNLSWFFSDWVDGDKGLPDISIDDVYPSSAAGPPPPIPHSSKSSASAPPGPKPSEAISGPEANTWLVTVNLSNSGYAAAEIPVTVRNADTSITQRVLVPARGKVTKRILIQGRPTQVQANDGTVPETEAGIHIKTLTTTPDSSSSSSGETGSPQQ